MIAPQLLSIFDDLFESAPGTIQPQTPFQELPGWGSIAFLGLIARIDEELGLTIAPADVLKSKTVADLESRLTSLKKAA